MPLKTLFPGFIKLHYTTVINTVVIPHVQTIPVNLTLVDGDNSEVTLRNGTAVLWGTALDAWVAVMKTIMDGGTPASAFITAELYSIDIPGAEPVFQSIIPISTVPTGSGGSKFAQQDVFTFRTAEGGHAKIYIMESVTPLQTHVAYAGMAVAGKAVVDYAIGDESLWYGRDNSYLSVSLFETTKTNDILRKKRLGL